MPFFSSIVDISVFTAYLCASAAGLLCALWIQRYGDHGRVDRHTSIAALLTIAIWAMSCLAVGAENPLSQGLAIIRNVAWIMLIYQLFKAMSGSVIPQIKWLVIALTFVEALQGIILLARTIVSTPVSASLFLSDTSALLGMMVGFGALVLVHNLYAGAIGSFKILRWSALATAVFWGAELGISTVAYGSENVASNFTVATSVLQNASMIVAGLMLCLAAKAANSQLRIKPSRTVTFQSLSALLILAYMLTIATVADALTEPTDAGNRWAVTSVLVAALVAGFLWLPSLRLRSSVRAILVKHLFRHRYDYRETWLNFSETLGQNGQENVPLEERAIMALANLTESKSGILFLPDGDDGLCLAARWNWPTKALEETASFDPLLARVLRDKQIVDCAPTTSGNGVTSRNLPEDNAWAVVPLLHYEKMVGAILLAKPKVPRALDWEDLDLLRVAASQIASYFSESHAQQALHEAARFDEFNRRIAFFMHDIKNLSSQLSLLLKNAEKHAHNPDFVADMLVTLRNSSEKLRNLLVRLGKYGALPDQEHERVDLAVTLRDLVSQFGSHNNVQASILEECVVSAPARAVTQAVSHFIQNAIDATDDSSPIMLECQKARGAARISIIDSGRGMTPQFLRQSLFQPFISTKADGFGIGAYEARELVRAMGGSVSVVSEPGVGSCFTITVPLAQSDERHATQAQVA